MRAAFIRWLSFCLVPLLLLVTTACGRGETRDVIFRDTDPANVRTLDLIGVNTHFGTVRVLGYTSAETALAHLADLGATSFRDYLVWYAFKFPASGPVLVGSQRLVKLLATMRNITPLINLGGTNTDIPGGVPPLTDEGLRYYEAYVTKAVSLTSSYKPIYEIWNEWNMHIGTRIKMTTLEGEGKASDPRAAIHYSRVAKAAVRAAKQADPLAKVVVGAVGVDDDWLWARAIVRYGALDGAAGLSVHLYNQCTKVRTATDLIDRVTQLQTLLKRQRSVETPIYITEFGWPTSDGNCGMSYDVTARNFAQFVLQAATVPWIKGIWMHEMKNISPDPVDRESNFGLYMYDDKPKPAVCFMKEAIAIVKAADRVELRRPFDNVFVMRTQTGGRQKIIMWTSSDKSRAEYTISGAPKGRIMCGKDISTQDDASRQLGPTPVIYDIADLKTVSVQITSSR